jgi:trehalose 6-phosphate phosphatase
VIPALGAEGRQRLARFVAGRPLLAFDIDGTLAPIVSQPDAARIPDALQQALRRLAERAPVVILTGRSRADAQRMVEFTPAHVLGNHGIEGLPGYEARTAALADLTSRWRAALDVPALRDAGVLVEDKRYSLSLHYRHAQDQAVAAAQIERRLASLEPAPLVIHGKCVVNVLPPGAITKGDALRALLAITGNPTALYAGDDDTDEHVFELPREQVLGVRVGLRPTTGATMYVDTPADMLPLVDTLIAHWPDGAPRA